MLTQMTMRIYAIAAAIVVLVLGGFMAWGHHNGKEAQRKADAPVISGLQNDLAQCRTTVATQGAALENQNAAIDRLQDEGEARAKEADKALRQAQGEAERYRLRARQIAAAKPGPDQCLSSRELVIDTLSGERQ